MTTTSSPLPPPSQPSPTPPAIDSHVAFQAAIRWGFDTAAANGAKHLIWCDPDFALWPLNDAAWLQAIGGWLRMPQRRLDLLARDFNEVPRRFARFMTWRRDWTHAIHYWQAPEELAGDLPSALVSDGAVSVQLLDAEHWRGRAQVDSRAAYLLRERVDVVLQRSASSFAVNTLGL
jgi:hypothetical protein